MSVQISELQILHAYINGVMGRAEHHALNVSEVALTLIGAVAWRNNGTIRVREQSGEMKNVLWFEVNDAKFALRYEHSTEQIELRRNTVNGELVSTFSNATPASEVRAIFATL